MPELTIYPNTGSGSKHSRHFIEGNGGAPWYPVEDCGRPVRGLG